MIRKLARRPAPATAIASVALFVSLSGVSYGVATGFTDSREIKDNTIRSRDIRNSTIRTQDLRNNEIRGGDVRNSTLTGRDVALNGLGGLDINESRLEKVGDANSLDGVDSSGFLRPDGTGFQAIPGATGDPAPQYDVDPLGYVHLQGQAQGGDGVLPPEARPAGERRFAVADGDDDGPEVLTVAPDGQLSAVGDFYLDSVTFRAAG
ncbi:MAG: hypothetical protein AABM31_00740 [Actinomycetota bacterium]